MVERETWSRPARAIFPQTARQETIQVRGYSQDDLAHARGLFLDDRRHRRDAGLAGKRPLARQHFVERDAKGVKVAAGIDGAVHSSRLLGRDVGERPSDELGRLGRLALARESRGDAEA